MLPASALLGLDFFVAYPVIAWLAWSTNLVLFEFVIRRNWPANRQSTAPAPSSAPPALSPVRG
jgi:hypothetical protein